MPIFPFTLLVLYRSCFNGLAYSLWEVRHASPCFCALFAFKAVRKSGVTLSRLMSNRATDGEAVASSSRFGSTPASWGKGHPKMYVAGVHTDKPHTSQSQLQLALGPTCEGLDLTCGWPGRCHQCCCLFILPQLDLKDFVWGFSSAQTPWGDNCQREKTPCLLAAGCPRSLVFRITVEAEIHLFLLFSTLTWEWS